MSCHPNIRRLEALQEVCGGAPGKKKKEDDLSSVDTSKMSAYEQQQFKLACSMKRTRDHINELEQLPAGAPVDQRARLGNQVRREIQGLSSEARALRPLALKEGKMTEYNQLALHVNRTEKLSKGRKQDDDADVTAPSAGRGVKNLDDLEMGDVGESGPSLRDDPEFAQFFEQTKKNDQEIDLALDRIGAGVTRLKNTALTIRDELKLQEALLQDTEDKVTNVHGKMKGLNKKLKETLKKVDKDRFCLYIFCCILLLGLAGGCYWVFVARKKE